jgi:hypothetical protein
MKSNYVYLCFVFTKGTKEYPPEISEFICTCATKELAEKTCEMYNNEHKGEEVYADFFPDLINTQLPTKER